MLSDLVDIKDVKDLSGDVKLPSAAGNEEADLKDA